MTDLRRHIPRVALEWDDEAPGRSWQSVDATLVFADISGFTALTERLARRGRIGAEELIETLNRVFGGMLGMAALRGGELLKFGGDALLFTFRGEGHAVRACAAAVDMRIALREAAKIPTSVGRLKLSMSVGIHSGPVDFFLVGAPTRELLILGPAATATAEAEHAAVAGEILVTSGTARRLPASATLARPDDLHLLRWRLAPQLGEPPAPMPVVPEARLRTLFPMALGEYLAERVPDPEHKVATIGFARFSGTDELLAGPGHDAVADALHRTISVFEEALIGEGVTLLATDLDSDGGKLFMSSGVPSSSEDDEGRMLRAMRDVLDVGTPLPLQIGVNRGHVFVAEVGAAERSAYSAMGDTTNTSARIMAKAPHGVLFAHPTVLEQSRTLFSTEPAGPFAMKGKTVPVPVFAVGEELGTRAAAAREQLPLIGREKELESLRAALERALGGEGGVVTVSSESGLGKSRLVTEAMGGLEATVTMVRAEPYGKTSPYRMLRDPVRQALRVERGDPEEMAAQALATFARRLPDLVPLAPLLTDVINVPLPSTAEASAIEPRFRPGRVADLIVALIDAAVHGPFVLLVEEAHWSDAASVAVLERIVAAAHGRPWAVVVVRRPEGEGFTPAEGTQIVLEPLPDDVMRRIVIAATEAAPLRPHEVDGIVARAGGNPLYVEELTRVFREVGSLDAMPESLHAALDAQIDALDPHSRRVLRYASVLGRSFRREVLNETLRSDDLVIDEATVSKLSTFLEPDGGERLRFRTGMIRDAAYEGLAYRLRTKLHTAAGHAVERLSIDLDADADTLSLHFWRGGDDASTWRYARMAGDRAARAYANTDAAVQYQRALDSARDLPAVGAVERLELLRQLGQVRELAGMYDGAVDALRQAARLAAGDRDESVAILLQRARTRQRAGAYRVALSEITRAQRLLDGDTSLEARAARVRLRTLRCLIRGEQERPADAYREASGLLEEARATGDLQSLTQALMVLSISSFQLGDFSVGDSLREALAISLEQGDLQRAFRAHNGLGGLALYQGRWGDALESFAGARSTALQVGDTVGAAQMSVSLGEILVSMGRVDEAEDVLTDAVRVLRVAGVHAFAAYGEIHRARVRLVRGDLVEAEQLAEDVELEFAALGQEASALEAALVRAESLTLQGRAGEALDVLEATGEAGLRDDVSLKPRVYVERARALLALGKVEDADAELAVGLGVAREYGMPYEEARLLQVLAELRSRTGLASPDDNEAAEEARAILRHLGVGT
ncbi:MAG TPA: adenylate/guanylate cyclase domain-containing protein [Candidatus Angelobacter sp.]|nr:adenylate/guanylate cyclase domain-containing protein [Candidatus Angelobacter sp.]